MAKVQENVKVVVIGGGSGGLELVSVLSKNNDYTITLVDNRLTHIWKPLLHEVASGSLDTNFDEISYINHAIAYGYYFQFGSLQSIDRKRKHIILSPVVNDKSSELISQRVIEYDILVICVGSTANDFSVPGVNEYCYFCDSLTEAKKFHQTMIEKQIVLLDFNRDIESKSISIAIVGGGATGVELAADLANSWKKAGITLLGKENQLEVKIHVIESNRRLLPNLPERISRAVTSDLKNMGVYVHTDSTVAKVDEAAVYTASGKLVSATIKVWATGIRAPGVCAELDGLEVNKINQLVVNDSLRTSNDDAIFAFGDCAYCIDGNNKLVPARAQAASQQVSTIIKNIQNTVNGRKLTPFVYKDKGSLINLSKYNTIGVITTRLSRSLFLEGFIAKMAYWFLYKRHQYRCFGFINMLRSLTSSFILRKKKSRLKLH